MITYEISVGFCLLAVCFSSGSANLTTIVTTQGCTGVWLVVPLFPLFGVFFITLLVETNRAPFDLPEAEAELVSGYNTEYSAVVFALFFLGEYSNMLLASGLCAALFFGGPFVTASTGFGFVGRFALKVVFFAYLFILARAALPRYRYDHLLQLGWFSLFPLTLGFFIFVVGYLFYMEAIPYSAEYCEPYFMDSIVYRKTYNW